eukprot:jgi/Chrzof1/12676/Cz07g03120.t1
MSVSSVHMQYEKDPTVPLPECVRGLQPKDVAQGSTSDSDFAKVIAALLYVACGGLDEAHNLITPLSWGSWTPYAGAPVRNSPAAAEASYVHALTHRQEGNCIGEFGSGFSNANYWYASAGQHEIFPKLLGAAQQAAQGNAQLEKHVHSHGDSWQPAKFVDLCSKAASSKDPLLLKFCDQIMKSEFDLLLVYCYQKG